MRDFRVSNSAVLSSPAFCRADGRDGHGVSDACGNACGSADLRAGVLIIFINDY